MASEVNYLTPEGQKNLEEELDQLHSTRRREVAERIHKASETGGTVDNAEYDEAKNEQAFVEGRISDLEHILIWGRRRLRGRPRAGRSRFWLVGHRHLEQG